MGRSARFYTRASVGWWQELADLCGWGTKDEKRFQCPLLDWEVGQSSTYRKLRSKELGTNLIGPEARGCVVTRANNNCVSNGHTS